MENEITESYITMPAGFKAAGVACGLKTDLGNSGPMDLLDLNMVQSDVPATVAGVYTKAQRSAPWSSIPRMQMHA